jgi:dethiobiotin synthetase
VGGPRSPIAADGDNVTLASAIAPDLVLLVAEAGLGAVNAVRMSVDAFAGAPIVVVLNRYDENDVVQHGNRDWLRDRDGYDVVTGPETAAARIVP